MPLTIEEKTAALDMLYLSACALTDTQPDSERLSAVHYNALYKLSIHHALEALVSEGLGLADYPFPQEAEPIVTALHNKKEMAVRKNLLLDSERAALCEFLEQSKIWYMPLKGIVLKSLYPKMGMRQMADNDILIDVNGRQKVRDWFKARGYHMEVYGTGHHDVYQKPPIYNYEMHISLCGESHDPQWYDYYQQIEARLFKDDHDSYGRHFSDEDFYVYLIVHGYKHYRGGGIGVRFLMDLYVYLEQKHSSMDLVCISRELERLGVIEFEQDCRSLVKAIFTDVNAFAFDRLVPKHQEMLLFFFTSGAHGTIENYVRQGIEQKGKASYVLDRLFPTVKVMKHYMPAVEKHRWLLPISWICRWLKVLFFRSDRAKTEIRTIIKAKRN